MRTTQGLMDCRLVWTQVHFHSGSFLNHAGVKSTELFLQVNKSTSWSEEGHVGLRRLLGSKTQNGKGLSEDRKH